MSLFYFHKVKNMSIDLTDKRNSTPLHWAVFSQAEISMLYILAWVKRETLVAKDKDGLTALHQALKKYESSRTLRALLYRGSPVDVRDSKGLTPIDYAHEMDDDYQRSEALRFL